MCQKGVDPQVIVNERPMHISMQMITTSDVTDSRDGSKYIVAIAIILYPLLSTINRGRSKCSYPPLFSLNNTGIYDCLKGWI